MRLTRYLDARTFCEEARKLKASTGFVSDRVLERLEEQRLLLPRLRLRYPEPIERRWWAESHENYSVGGEQEPDGPRWEDACALERARQRSRWISDPTATAHPLDDPEPRFLQFIERPAEQPSVSTAARRINVGPNEGEPLYTSNTVVSFYSSWQLLQFAEVVNMGVMSFINLLETSCRPTDEDVLAAPRSTSFLPIHAMRGFQQHGQSLDSMVWFAEEANLGYCFATRAAHHRRLLSEEEQAEIMRTRLWAAQQAIARHGVSDDDLLSANRFLFEQWAHWHGEGRPLIAGAYKTMAAQGVRLAYLAGNVTVEEYRARVGQAGGYFKPIMDVIWPDWGLEQREDAKRVLVSYRSPGALLKADFTDALVDRFLDFIEEQNLHGFYWRLESFHRHSFKGNDYSLEGLKGDVQGMAVVIEHIASALGARKEQLRDKFKELWANDPAVLKLLKNNAVMKVGNSRDIDLAWFEERVALGLPEETAADLAITYAIRGGAHRVIEEVDPLKLERMMLIMLRAALKTFAAARGS